MLARLRQLSPSTGELDVTSPRSFGTPFHGMSRAGGAGAPWELPPPTRACPEGAAGLRMRMRRRRKRQPSVSVCGSYGGAVALWPPALPPPAAGQAPACRDIVQPGTAAGNGH